MLTAAPRRYRKKFCGRPEVAFAIGTEVHLAYFMYLEFFTLWFFCISWMSNFVLLMFEAKLIDFFKNNFSCAFCIPKHLILYLFICQICHILYFEGLKISSARKSSFHTSLCTICLFLCNAQWTLNKFLFVPDVPFFQLLQRVYLHV